MSLVTCEDCGGDVPFTAKKCPHCGVAFEEDEIVILPPSPTRRGFMELDDDEDGYMDEREFLGLDDD